MTDWKYYQNNYPVNQNLIWLNNCGTTPASTDTKNSIMRYLEGYAEKGVLSEVEKYPSVRKSIIRILSKLLNCEEEELGIIHNTSEGMNFISWGFNLKQNDEILLLENEYPSNVYPWNHWKEHGVKIDFIPQGLTPEEFFFNLKSKTTSHTKVISISAVHWCTGMPLPIEKIGDFCSQHSIDLVIDGAQGVGHVDIDVKKCKIPFMAFSAWKWLLGPIGLGVIYVNKEKLKTIKNAFLGQNSVVEADEYLPYKEEIRLGAERFEYSTVNFMDWVYFKSILETLDKIGFPTVMARIYDLANYLKSGLKSIGYEVLSDRFPENNTGIIACYKQGTNTQNTFQYLKNNGIVGALRLGNLRFAPHIYNSEEQLDKVVQMLKNSDNQPL
ncbi:MAG: aminotransferase class V-fold PLP-dependent enzyme [Leptospiraceae bacterium]|nr:aminotransferase class V-fold PLP-dependent enzyme [Leptospiraceae bacterium]MCP5498060.1 aminotransferase class V-fold PLP-dependent enzyme [Leptospiraceae bacterium]